MGFLDIMWHTSWLPSIVHKSINNITFWLLCASQILFGKISRLEMPFLSCVFLVGLHDCIIYKTQSQIRRSHADHVTSFINECASAYQYAAGARCPQNKESARDVDNVSIMEVLDRSTTFRCTTTAFACWEKYVSDEMWLPRAGTAIEDVLLGIHGFVSEIKLWLSSRTYRSGKTEYTYRSRRVCRIVELAMNQDSYYDAQDKTEVPLRAAGWGSLQSIAYMYA